MIRFSVEFGLKLLHLTKLLHIYYQLVNTKLHCNSWLCVLGWEVGVYFNSGGEQIQPFVICKSLLM